ncbi:MAG: hypothetical protein JWO77_2886 [Ilumatobacteraceae bacterium]|nr:hypothetical protein [Ilumatobacteraceae bacterium]
MFRKEWRQQALILGLVTIAVAIAVAGSTMAMNAAGATQPGFGSAGATARIPIADPARVPALIASAEARYGSVEVIGHRDTTVAGSADRLDIRAQDPDGRFGHSMLALRDGRYPTAVGEVALTPAVADLLGAGIGDQVELDRKDRTVVGLVENPTGLGDDFALVAPDRGRSATTLVLLFERPGTAGRSARGTGTSDPRSTDESGLASVPVMIRGDNGPVAALVLVAVASAMTLVGLIAAAGFVVVAQRRQRQLGLLAAIGATERHLRLVVVANGAIVGLVAAVAGTGLGVLGWALATPAVEAAADRRLGRFDLPWGVVLGCAAIAVVVSVAAAWWPARRMARIPVMAALAGRPPSPAPVHRSLLVAMAALVAGVAAIATAIPHGDDVKPLLLIAGVIAVAVGTVFAAPAVIKIGAAPAAHLAFSRRLALRDLARFQSRSAAALAAITFVVGISVTIVAIAGVNQYRTDEGNLSSRQLLIEIAGPQADPTADPGLSAEQSAALDARAAAIGSEIEGADVLALDVARRPATSDPADPMLNEPLSVALSVGDHSWRHLGYPPVATPELLEHYGIDPASIRPGTELLSGDHRDVTILDISRRDPGTTKVQRVELPPYTSAPRWLITEHALHEHGWEAVRSGWLVDADHALTTDEIASARAAAADAGMTIEVRSSQDSLAALRTVTTGAAALLALAILAMTVGLIRSESARDLRTLTATGANSRTRRALTASTAGFLGAMGVALGTAGAYVALTAGYHSDLGRLVPLPWAHLATIAIGLPLLATAAGWVLAGREPSGFSRQTFD